MCPSTLVLGGEKKLLSKLRIMKPSQLLSTKENMLMFNMFLRPLYTWGWIEGQPELSKFGLIGSLDFIKSGPRAFIFGVGSNTHLFHVAF